MTDIRTGGLAREVLLTASPRLNIAGLAREVLITTPTAAYVAGVVREALLSGAAAVALGYQTSIAVNTG